MAYHGLILDFGGVITTDVYACLSDFCVREGLAPDAVTGALSVVPEVRDVFTAAEAGCVPQRELELMLVRQLGMAAVHFTGAPSDFAEIERLIGIESSCRLRPAKWGLTRHDSCSREETDG